METAQDVINLAEELTGTKFELSVEGLEGAKEAIIKAKKAEIIEMVDRLDLDAKYCLERNDFDSFDEIRDLLEADNLLGVDIIYYGTAMDYLKENDPSLKESLELAHDMGFTAKNLNSEMLASLLATEALKSQFYELETEINGLFEDLEELVSEIDQVIEEFEKTESNE